jgi:phosphoribosylaminoimidazole-succinocarboxamide synthase
MTKAIYSSQLTSLPLLHKGKVRDNYAVGQDKMLIVATDRLSAFDVIMNEPIPEKGAVLTQMAQFWFDRLAHIVPNHLTGIAPDSVVCADEVAQVRGRSMVVKRLKPLPIEAVVRGYIIGSGWKDYQATGSVCGIELPKGLKLAEKLPEPIFTPASKAAVGEHDENISFDTLVATIGETLAKQIKDVSIRLYQEAAEYAATRGIIIADTKFEFGLDEHNQLTLMDEVLTADSSRYWPADQYQVGVSPPSYDKQFVRDYLEALQDWPKKPPAPAVPEAVIQQTADKYRRAYEVITGKSWASATNAISHACDKPVVGVVMGSSSDWDVMKHAVAVLQQFDIPYEAQVVSAHRMPDEMFNYAEQARQRGLKVIIAGAGGAAHLPGMISAKTILPVLGVPVPSKYLKGEDSLLSIVQMPKGIPVLTLAIGEAGAANAGLSAVAILATTDAELATKLQQFRTSQSDVARNVHLPSL